MGSSLMTIANYFAAKSTPKWNQNRVTRTVCRKMYRLMNDLYVYSHPVPVKRGSCTNTYPWPYVGDFANWEEEADDALGYNLISDQSNFVIRRSPSYIAWKLRELHKKWPKTSDGWHPHAKEWVVFLRRLGYPERWTTKEIIDYYRIQPRDKDKHLEKMPYFVGVSANYGEYGQLYWFEYVHAEELNGQSSVRYSITATTYENFRFQIVNLRVGDDVEWVRVG